MDKEDVENIEDVIVEVIKAPVKIPVKVVSSFFDWLDGD